MSTDDLREQVIDALVMSPMSDHVGTVLDHISRTADALMPIIREAQARALTEAADDWSDWDALNAPEDWLRNRATTYTERTDR